MHSHGLFPNIDVDKKIKLKITTMTHRFAILLATMLATMSAFAAQRLQDPAVGRLFCSEPGMVLADLSPATRAEMLAYYIGGQVVEKDNDMGEKAAIDTVTDQYMRLHTSVSRSVQMRLLCKGQSKGDTVIAVIETVKTPVADSRLSFYDTQWRPIATKRVFKDLPTIGSFIRPGTSKADAADLMQRIDFAMITFDFEGPDHSKLVARQRLDEFYSAADYKPMGKHLIKSITFTTVGGRLRKATQQ